MTPTFPSQQAPRHGVSSDTPPSDEDAAAIRERMKRVRHKLNVDVESVRKEASDLLDWKSYVQAKPLTCVAAAAVAGYFLAPATTRVVRLTDDQVKGLARAGGINVTAKTTGGSSRSGLAGVLMTVGGLAARGILARYAAQLTEKHSPLPTIDPNS
ncbi:hypothetical protein [Botrimarina sp.]|uniref:hypothetical protein n=1 Tax=Botrimarina sp. TaxID=2795802 RepID=UPI0032ECCADF